MLKKLRSTATRTEKILKNVKHGRKSARGIKVVKSTDIFAYNLRNLQDTCKLRGENRKRVLKEMEFMRTHEFKSMPRKGNKSFGVWIKRQKPIRKIKNFKCKR